MSQGTDPTRDRSQAGALARWRWPLVALALALAAMAGRAVFEQTEALARARVAEADGDAEAAIVEYRWVLRWATPVGPHDGEAAEALLRIATDAEAQRPDRAAFALDALRSGLIASRWLWQPRAALLADINARLPPWLVRVAERRGDGRDKQELLAQLQADYARPVGVPGWLSLLVGLGFCAFLCGLFGAWARGVDADGRWHAAAWPWVLAALGGFAVWTSALWFG